MPRWFSHILHIVARPDGQRFVVTQPTVSKGYRYLAKDRHNSLTHLGDKGIIPLGVQPKPIPEGVELRFYSSVRMRVARKGNLGSRGNEHGICVGVKVIKNKVAPPWQTAEFDIEWGQGISHEGDILNVALEAGVITSSGGYFKHQGENIGTGARTPRSTWVSTRN